jgi:hypothetical protein
MGGGGIGWGENVENPARRKMGAGKGLIKGFHLWMCDVDMVGILTNKLMVRHPLKTTKIVAGHSCGNRGGNPKFTQP